LAQEFLTWLWFRCEVEGGEFDLEGGAAAVVVEDALSFTSWDPDGTKATVRGGTPTIRPEAASALAAGLTLKRAKLLVARGDRERAFLGSKAQVRTTITVTGTGFLTLGASLVVRRAMPTATAVQVLDDRTLTSVTPAGLSCRIDL